MAKQKVYLETTMFNYYFDTHKEANPATIRFFEAIDSGQFEAYTSIYAIEELANAPEPKRTNMLNLVSKYNILVLPGSNEALNLAKKYISSGIIPEKKLIDALQIAIASLHGISMILSFNFSHINKVKTKIMVPAVNQTEGFQSVIITQPQEVIDYE